MQYKILPTAQNSLIQIWHYTDQKWGDKQADKYIHGIYETVEDISDNKHLWRNLEHRNFKGIFFVRFEYHFIFFRELSPNTLGIVSVLHERMNIPGRLKDDLDAT